MGNQEPAVRVESSSGSVRRRPDRPNESYGPGETQMGEAQALAPSFWSTTAK